MPTVRMLDPQDWEICRRLRLNALAEAPYAFMSTLAREQQYDEDTWRRRLGSPTAATYMAWIDGEPVGMATGKVDDPADEYGVPGAWQLVGMWVDPSVRGNRVADELVEAVAGHAKAQDATDLVLWVTEINERASAFYRRMGFVLTGARQPVRPDEPDNWEAQMIRRLG